MGGETEDWIDPETWIDPVPDLDSENTDDLLLPGKLLVRRKAFFWPLKGPLVTDIALLPCNGLCPLGDFSSLPCHGACPLGTFWNQSNFLHGTDNCPRLCATLICPSWSIEGQILAFGEDIPGFPIGPWRDIRAMSSSILALLAHLAAIAWAGH